MMRQKGQIQIVLILLVIIAIVFATQFSGKWSQFFDLFKFSPSESIKPASPQKSLPRSSSQEIIQPSSPSPPAASLPDLAAPSRFNGQPQGSLSAETRKILLSLETDEKAACKYSTVAGVYYEYMQGIFDETNSAFHAEFITTLSEGEDYKYYVRCIDEAGNKNMDDFVISFGVSQPIDVTPPELFYLSPMGALPAGTRETMLSVSTNEPASCYADATKGSGSGSMNKDSTGKHHTRTVSGLVDGQVYEYFIRCQDSAGNEKSNVMIRFEVGI